MARLDLPAPPGAGGVLKETENKTNQNKQSATILSHLVYRSKVSVSPASPLPFSDPSLVLRAEVWGDRGHPAKKKIMAAFESTFCKHQD